MATIVNIFASPGEAFASLKERPRFLLALLLITLGATLVQLFYFLGVDIQWFFEEQLLSNPNTTQQQAEQALRFLTNIPQTGLAVVFAIITAIFVIAAFLIQALYFKVASQFTKDGLTYKHFVALICWSSMPRLLASLASLVKVLTGDISLLPPTQVNPLALWEMLGLEPMGTGTLDQLVMNTDPTTIWTLALVILGYKILSGKGWATAAIVSLIPVVIVYSLAFIF
jgi:hypothetical protein